jgi:hypothetical protein
MGGAKHLRGIEMRKEYKPVFKFLSYKEVGIAEPV